MCWPACYLLSVKANDNQELNELSAFRSYIVQKWFSVLLLAYASHSSRKMTLYSECVKNESFILFYEKVDFSLFIRWQNAQFLLRSYIYIYIYQIKIERGSSSSIIKWGCTDSLLKGWITWLSYWACYPEP
jgi:hypothetical protein